MSIQHLTAERNAYKACLDGLEMRNLNDMVAKGPSFAATVGRGMASIIKSIAVERDAAVRERDAAVEALRHTCKHLCQWKDACETGCVVSAALAEAGRAEG